jgi:hypothetical protein
MYPQGKREKIMREVTVEEVAQVLDAAVRDKGEDFVYVAQGATCQYLHGTQPGCLVGHVLLSLGAIPGELALQEGCPADVLNYGRLGLSIPLNVIDALQTAQNEQDEGRTWGQARKAFSDHLSRFNAPLTV